MDHAYQPHIWVYHGATAEDVYSEQDSPSELNLELMASPQCSLVALSYSIDHVETVARAMWDDIQGDYEEAAECGLPFSLALQKTVSTRTVECPAGYDGPMEVFEVVQVDYSLNLSAEPLMRVIAQKRTLHP
jgi:hypothetical protein